MTSFNIEKLNEIRQQTLKKEGDWIKVGMSTCGIAAGADTVLEFFRREIVKRGINIKVVQCGCDGMCHAEPLVDVKIEGLPQVVYGNVNEQIANEIIEKHVLGKRLLNDHIYKVKVQ